VPVQAQVEENFQPLSLAIVIQATTSAQSVLDKLRKETSLLGPLLIGDRGEAAVIAFANEVRVLQNFTSDAEKFEGALRNLDAFGEGGTLIDALAISLRMLQQRAPQRRRAILLVSEKRDRGSKEGLELVIRLAEHVNATVFALSFSPTKTVFANHAPKYCDRKCRRCTCKNCGNHCDREQPAKVPSNTQAGGGMDLFKLFVELKRQSQPNVPQALASLTGGDSWDVVRKRGFEAALQRIGEDLHHQYLVTFPMSRVQPGSYHKLRIEIRDRPQLVTRTRTGYYEVAE
jgi:VWFA-related protein